MFLSYTSPAGHALIDRELYLPGSWTADPAASQQVTTAAGSCLPHHRRRHEHAGHPAPPDQIPLTRNEIAALFSTLIIKPVTGIPHRLRWSAWRRRHQHRAKTSHYQRQARQPSLSGLS